MNRTVLVAGATGMMGSKIAAAVLDRGGAVRLLVRGGRNNAKFTELEPLVARGAEIMDADVTDPDSLKAPLQGVDVIVSALQGGPDVIIDGQRALAQAGVEAGVRRIFPSDFSVDFRDLTDDEHIFLTWRRHGDAAIATTGLPQTNTFNGAFTEMLLEPFLGLVDWDGGRVSFWGDPDQLYDFTTTDDVAAYVAAAALDPDTPDGAFQISGEEASPRQLVDIVGRLAGQPFALRCLGSLDDLDAEIARRQAEAREDPMVWAGLQYHRAMASGRGKLNDIANTRYPDIRPTPISTFLGAARAERAA